MRRRTACLFSLLILGSSCLLTSCSSFGRKFNQALPEFLRSDPGADELARYRERVRVLRRTEDEREIARQAFAAAKEIYDAENWRNAAVNFEQYLDDYPDTPEDKEARYLLIHAHLNNDEPFAAKEAIKSFIANYPISNYNDRIEKTAFDLALAYMRGDNDVFIFSKVGDGVKLLRDVVLNFPTGNHAAEAQWRLGNYYFDEHDLIEAVVAYGAVVERYRESPWAAQALFNRGLSRFRQVKGAEYDPKIKMAAIEDFREYLARFPEAARRDEAQQHIDALVDMLAQREISLADWYEGQGFDRAARYYLTKAVSRYPGTDIARDAQARLDASRENQTNYLEEAPPKVEATPQPNPKEKGKDGE